MMEINQFLKFTPILKEKIWGGEKLIKLLNKKSDKKNIGESWEISDVKENTSIVSNGELQGTSLKELIQKFKSNLVGKKNYEQFGEQFPLLIKFIDAKTPLSIQLHPNNELAKKRHNSFGKTEMWYVMQADEKANLIVGFQQNSNEKEYLHHLKNKTLLNILNVDEVQKGDVYFIPVGRIHAIGAGVLLAEIQQTSDITYRIYDWDRQDAKGNYRELHTKQAIDAINYQAEKSYKSHYKKQENTATEIVNCPYFTTNILPISKKIKVNHQNKDSFVIYMCVAGEVEFSSIHHTETLVKGETILVPACLKEFKILPKKKSELLEVYIH